MANPISREEFEGRRAAAIASAREHGFDALLLCARGGGTVDRYANVFYLTNFYSSFPYIPDEPGHWSGRAHSYLLLPLGAPPHLVADLPYVQDVALDAACIEITEDVIGSVIRCLRERGLGEAHIGLVGEDTLPLGHYRQIHAALPGIRWEAADRIMARLRAIKSPGEIERLRAAARIGSRMLDAMMEAAVPGARHGDVVAAGLQVLVPAGGILYNSFMASGRGGDRPSAVRHSFPTWGASEPLAEGQWLRLAISGVLDGYYFDVSRARPIGPPSNAQIDAFEAAIEVVNAGLAAARPVATAADVANAALARQAALGYPIQGVFSGLGHGIGLGWDSPWLVPDEVMRLAPGMVINVERTVSRDGYVGDFEETVLITETGSELLTDARVRRW